MYGLQTYEKIKIMVVKIDVIVTRLVSKFRCYHILCEHCRTEIQNEIFSFLFVRHLLHSLGFEIEVHSVSIIKDNALLAFAEKKKMV